MPELSFLYDLLQTLLPFEIMQMRFMQQALLGLLLLAPMVARLGDAGIRVSLFIGPEVRQLEAAMRLKVPVV